MRPKTLAEVAQLAARGDSFDRCLANFLDEFYAAPDVAALSPTPELLAPKFPLAQSGVRFGKQYSVGQRRSFHSASRRRTR